MSVKKLKKIGDPETFLCRAVLINNTLESVKSKTYHGESRRSVPVVPGPPLERSHYNEDEQRILNKVLLPSYLSPGLSFHDNKDSVSRGYTTITLPEPIT